MSYSETVSKLSHSDESVDSGWRLAVDIGGTFTDVVLLDDTTGAVVVAKTLTTPNEPLEGVREGCRKVWDRAGIAPSAVVGAVVHATTLVTNALIEDKGARSALVTTEGFGDTLLIRNEHRYDMYDLQIELPEPPIPSERTFELSERTLSDGTVLTTPTPDDIGRVVEELRTAEVEAVAVCLLHSYANPANERLLADAIHEGLGIPVCVSSEIAPQIREYPRMTTTACNAVTMPLVADYLGELKSWLFSQDVGSTLFIMMSNGGVVSADASIRTPVRMIESGPAAGALATSWYAQQLDEPRILSFDMGGTTAKACLIDDFEPTISPDFEVSRMYRFKKGSGHPLTMPSVDLVEIGAGGGSIAHVDNLGLLKVGPESTGADPGPACYAAGGTEPTVTDADLALGYLDSHYFLGGEMTLDVEAAETALDNLGSQLGLSALDAAAGIHEVVNQNMAAAARMHGVERGADLRGVPLVAFGGAGPVHACGVAELLDADRVVFPVDASVLSAFGTLVTPVRVDLARSRVARLDSVTDEERESLLDEMRQEATEILGQAGVDANAITFRYGIDARYQGQGNEITIWVGEGERWPLSYEATNRTFAKEYEAVYGLSIPDVPVEVVTWRLSAAAPTPTVELGASHKGAASAQPKSKRSVVFERGEAAIDVPVFERDQLEPGVSMTGPRLIEEPETTIVLRPGWSAKALGDGTIVAQRERT
ncbi:MAG: hydantoinase/oxoprolinase family protein [Acidimicrobiia bacterium]|nr:hydantoinase/oxoprolinase family protein [Acidimicrobiia bacterium]